MSDVSQGHCLSRDAEGKCVLALSSVSVASAVQYRATSHHKQVKGNTKAKAKGTLGLRSTASAAVADIQTGAIWICSVRTVLNLLQSTKGRS